MEHTSAPAASPAVDGKRDINQFVVFRLGDNEFAVSIEQVQEILIFSRPTRVPRLPRFIEGIINVRGKIVPVINLRERFEIPSRAQDSDTRIIVVEVAEQTIGMVVDMVTEVTRLPLAAIEPPPSLIATVSSTFVTGIGKLDGRILVLLDLERMLSPDELLAVGAPQEVPAARSQGGSLVQLPGGEGAKAAGTQQTHAC